METNNTISMNFSAIIQRTLQIAISMAIYIHFFLPTQPVYTSSHTGHHKWDSWVWRVGEKTSGTKRSATSLLERKKFLHSNERFSRKQRTVDWWETAQNCQQPFLHIQPFRNGTVAPPSVPTKQALSFSRPREIWRRFSPFLAGETF